ncbi:MAG TPA: hypothetical protein VJM15_01955 [Sphingomicrobium sp.]|nr:hypothetical protein [Sphingomicrobium sp.]
MSDINWLSEGDPDIALSFPDYGSGQPFAGAQFNVDLIASGELSVNARRQAVGRKVSNNADVTDAPGVKQRNAEKRQLANLTPALCQKCSASR